MRPSPSSRYESAFVTRRITTDLPDPLLSRTQVINRSLPGAVTQIVALVMNGCSPAGTSLIRSLIPRNELPPPITAPLTAAVPALARRFPRTAPTECDALSTGLFISLVRHFARVPVDDPQHIGRTAVRATGSSLLAGHFLSLTSLTH